MDYDRISEYILDLREFYSFSLGIPSTVEYV